jgi:hypothetical protein
MMCGGGNATRTASIHALFHKRRGMSYYVQLMRAFAARAIAANAAVGAFDACALNYRVHADATWSSNDH